MLNHEYPPLGGGAGVVTQNVAKRLVQAGHHVQVITTRTDGMSRYQESDAVQVHRVMGRRSAALDNQPVRNLLVYLMRGRRLGRKLIAQRRPDVIHADMTVPAGLLAAELSRACAGPMVVVLHGSDVPGYSPDEFWLRIKLLTPLLRLIWRRSAAVVAVSEGLRRLALKSYPQGEIHVIHNGVDTQRFCPPDSPRDHRGPLRILTACRLVKRKGIQFLLQALAMAKRASVDFRLTVVGDGNYSTQLKDLARRHGLQEVEFLGSLRQEQLPEIYRSAEILASPSLTEAFGLTAAEAMACGTPVLSSNVGGVPEIVRDRTDGYLVPPADPGAILEALGWLLARRNELDAMGMAGRRRIVAQFSWQQVTQKYLDVYRLALEGRKRGTDLTDPDSLPRRHGGHGDSR